MSSFPAFDAPWSAEMIERFRHDTEKAKTVNPAIDGVGTCIMVAACILAEAIDRLTTAIKENRP